VHDSIAIRPATPDDHQSILQLAGDVLGWTDTGPHREFFVWKHFENPAGVSPMWVAIDGEAVVGFRSMLLWQFCQGDTTITAARAVDTATAASHRRQGIFSTLTQAAVENLTANSVDFVFNTPNSSSRPGYLALGWNEAGRVPVSVVPTLRGLTRTARARTAADKWSIPLDAGQPIDALASDLAHNPAVDASKVCTHRTQAFLRWRFGFDPLGYRVISTDDAAAVVRQRRRGPATETVVADLWADGERSTRRLVNQLRKLGGDHLIVSAPTLRPWSKLLPMGPKLTTRPLASAAPTLDRFHFSVGDIELF